LDSDSTRLDPSLSIDSLTILDLLRLGENKKDKGIQMIVKNPAPWAQYPDVLWSADMPGIYAFLNKRQSDTTKPLALKFENFVQTNGYSVHALFHNLSPNRRTGSHSDSTNGYGSSYYKSRLKENQRLSLLELTEVRALRDEALAREKGWKFVHPGRYNKGFHGIINAKNFFDHYGKRAKESARPTHIYRHGSWCDSDSRRSTHCGGLDH
jgi:hypothetical protein